MRADRNQVAMLTQSEAEAARLLATTMGAQGNPDAIAQRFPAGWIVSLGPGRFVNRAMCTEPALDDDAIAAVIDFFSSRDMAPSIQVPGWVAAEHELHEHGFSPDWTRSLLRWTPSGVASTMIEPSRGEVGLTVVDEANLDSWLDVLADGNETPPAVRPVSDEFGRAAHAVPGSVDLFADLGAEPVACGSLQVVDGVGWLGGAATLPGARGQGLQATLLAHRIQIASGLDVRFIAATAVPGSGSERNLLRAGFEVVDTQTVWTAAT